MCFFSHRNCTLLSSEESVFRSSSLIENHSCRIVGVLRYDLRVVGYDLVTTRFIKQKTHDQKSLLPDSIHWTPQIRRTAGTSQKRHDRWQNNDGTVPSENSLPSSFNGKEGETRLKVFSFC